MADAPGIPIVHVTRFNAVYWDCGRSPVHVVEHGIPDPGARTGPATRPRRGGGQRPGAPGPDRPAPTCCPVSPQPCPARCVRHAGAGLAAALHRRPEQCREYDDLPQARMHGELARRRVYVHPLRWTSLGLSLIEAMQLAMPVVALAATEATAGRSRRPPGRSRPTRPSCTRRRAGFIRDPAAAREAGLAAREAACDRYGLKRFLADWDEISAGGDRMRIAMVSEHADPDRRPRRGRRRRPERPRRRAGPGSRRHGTIRSSSTPGWPARTRSRLSPSPPGSKCTGWPPARPCRCPRTSCCRTWLNSAPRWAGTGAGSLRDLVHAHFWMSGLASLQGAAGLRIPVAQTFHALGSVKARHQRRRDTSPPQRIDAERRIGLACDQVIATCRDEVRELGAARYPTWQGVGGALRRGHRALSGRPARWPPGTPPAGC